MKYVARKHCTFNGKKYIPGNIIPATAFPAYMARRLVFNGIIAEVDEMDSTETITIPIMGNAHVDSVEISVDNLIPVLVGLQKNSQEAIESFTELETENQQILFCALENRKGVSSEVEKLLKGAKSTEKQEEEGEA